MLTRKIRTRKRKESQSYDMTIVARNCLSSVIFSLSLSLPPTHTSLSGLYTMVQKTKNTYRHIQAACR